MKKIFFFLILILLVRSAATAADPGKSHVTAHLLSEADSIQPGHPLWVGVELKADKGWHIYWKNPGDSGMATKVKWILPDGFTLEPLQWPYPRKFTDTAGVAYGYSGSTLLLNRMEAPAAFAALPEGATVAISARVDWVACAEVCQPGRADLSLTFPVLPASDKRSPVTAKLFSEGRLKLPLPISDTEWKVQAFRRKRKIQILLTPPESFKFNLTGLTFFPGQQNLIDPSEPMRFERVKGQYLLEFPYSPLASVSPSFVDGVIVSRYGWRGSGSPRALAVNVRIE